MSGTCFFLGRYAGIVWDADRRILHALVEMPIALGGPLLDRLGPPPAPGEGPLVCLRVPDLEPAELAGGVEATLRAHLRIEPEQESLSGLPEIADIPLAAAAVLALLGLRLAPRGSDAGCTSRPTEGP